MDEGEASEGDEREWGGECEQWITTMRRPIDRVAPLPPFDLRINNQLRGRVGRTR